MAIKKNDCIPLTITGMTAEGNGVGRYEGMAVFVPCTAPGDQIEARVAKLEKNYAYGILERLLLSSPARVENDCPPYRQCGGCVYRHLSYAAECAAKEQRVADAIRRIGGFTEVSVRPILSAVRPERYRNKAQFPFGRDAAGNLCVGFFAPRSHRVVPVADCLLQPEFFSTAAREVLDWAREQGLSAYDERAHRGQLRHLYLRTAAATGETMVCVVANAAALPGEEALVKRLTSALPGVKSILLNSNTERTNVILGRQCRTLWGKDCITDRLCGLLFELSPLSFYQVNRDQAERLYQEAADCAGLRGDETLLDLYCGTGTIGLSMARAARRVIGVEIVEEAVQNARKNAQRNGIQNAEFLCADASVAAERLAQRNIAPDVVVLDPPRKGCTPALVETVAQRLRPRRVVYVSCDPGTLARDLKYFRTFGFTPKRVTPVDMFPRTAHVETVVLLSHKKPDSHINVKVEFGEGEGKVPLKAIAERAEAYKPRKSRSL